MVENDEDIKDETDDIQVIKASKSLYFVVNKYILMIFGVLLLF